ncbi:MAG TPA: hypothetical protein VKE51_14510 [Vicinamibacterales bacterium]|nr:hypothetical protein [Vicinamibacterales bacterium]
MAGALDKRTTAGALLLGGVLAVASPTIASAQGRGNQGHGHGSPPSSSPLPGVTAPPPGIGATPIPWIDDANLMPSGAMSVDVSMSHWAGDQIGETTLPAINVAIGLADRFQVAVSVPHIVGDEASGVAGGLGTTYVSGKYAAFVSDRGVKVAVAPTLELLGTGVLSALGADETRAQFGVPVSLEIDGNERRVYCSSGWFSRGVWFAGAGVALQLRRRVGVSGSFSRSWTSPVSDAIDRSRDRAEFSGGIGVAVASHTSLFGSVSHTIATTAENGAGATISAGMSFYVAPARAAGPAPPRR